MANLDTGLCNTFFFSLSFKIKWPNCDNNAKNNNNKKKEMVTLIGVEVAEPAKAVSHTPPKDGSTTHKAAKWSGCNPLMALTVGHLEGLTKVVQPSPNHPHPLSYFI